MTNNTIAILMATYNGEEFIIEQIESILNQTYTDWILLIHDDGSKDSTIDIISYYSELYPNKIIHLEDKYTFGSSKGNFTYLLKIVDDRFNYIMFSDQDDVWKSDKIEKTFIKMKEEEHSYGMSCPIIIFSDLIVVNKNLEIISDSMWKYQRVKPSFSKSINRLGTCNVVTGCTMMINKAAKLEYRLTKNAIMHDWLLSLQVLKAGGRISFVNEGLIFYRQHSSNVCGAKQSNIIRYIKKIISLNKFINENLMNYKMLKELNIVSNILTYCFLKIKTTFIRFFS